MVRARHHRGSRLLLGVAVLLVVVMTSARPAAAELNGPCTANGTFRPLGVEEGPGVPVDPSATNRATVPRDGTVQWEGTVNQPDAPRSHDGAIFIDTPITGFLEFFAGSSFNEVEVWGGDDETGTSKSDFEDYEVVDWIPGGAEIVVSGFHLDGGLFCDGSVTLVIDDDFWSSPTTLIAAAGIPIFVVALLIAMRGGGGRHPLGIAGTLFFALFLGLLLGALVFDSGAGLILAVLFAAAGVGIAVLTRRRGLDLVGGRPNVGWVGGLIGGLLIAVLAWAAGLWALDSPLMLITPIILMLLGFGAGLWGPWGASSVATAD